MFKIQNKWSQGKVRFEFLSFKEVYDGIMPYRAILDEKIGQETVLFLKDTTDFIYKLASVKPFTLMTKSGLVNSDYGPLLFVLFYVKNPNNETEPFWMFDLHLNPFDEDHLKPFYELSEQSHIHVFLLDNKNEQVNFFEFENTFNFDETLKMMKEACRGMMCKDFLLAKKELCDNYSLEDLYNMN